MLIDDSWCAALNLSDPDAIRLVDDLTTQLSLLAVVLNHVGIASSAFTFGFLVGGCAGIIVVSAQSDTDLLSAPERCNLVVPAVGVSLPVLLVWAFLILVGDVIEAEVIVTTNKAFVLVDTAALVRWTLCIGHFINSASVAHRAILFIYVLLIVVDHHILSCVFTFLSVSSASDGIIV